MKSLLVYITLLLTVCRPCFSQITDDFEDGDLTVNPVWSGDITHFNTNIEGILRLESPTAGRSFIYSGYSIPDSFKFSVDHGLEFSPSASNFSRIYLFIDNTDLRKANGYYLSFGENGNEDAVRLYKMVNGNSTNIGSGKTGAIAGNSNDIQLELIYNSKSEWILKTSYDKGNTLNQEFIIKEPFAFNNSGYFAIECIYTSTRRDKYYFDNLDLDLLRPDTKAPTFVRAVISGPSNIDVEFSEEILLPQINSIQISPGTDVKEVVYTSGKRNGISIITSSALAEGVLYTITLNNTTDLSGNITAKSEFKTGLYKGPIQGDVLITEILFDPVTNGEDFIEIYNQSGKIINLSGSKIGNLSRNQEIKISKDLLMPPRSYLCLTPSAEIIKQIYSPPNEAMIISQTLPLFNADMGKASLINEKGILIDSLTYNSRQHNPLLNNTKGVSLERIRTTDGRFTSLWTSGIKSTNYGTPGYENSNTTGNAGSATFELVNKTFSPNGDGVKDQIILSYNLQKPGFIANITIYSETGHLVKKLSQGELLGSNGFISWNGLNDNLESERIGVYNMVLKAFHSDGETIEAIFPCILASK